MTEVITAPPKEALPPSPKLKEAPKPITQRAIEILKKIWERRQAPNPNPEQMLKDIAQFPANSPETQPQETYIGPASRKIDTLQQSQTVLSQEERISPNHEGMVTEIEQQNIDDVAKSDNISQEARKEEHAVIREFTKSTPEGREARSDAARRILDLRAQSRETREQQRKYLTTEQIANEQHLATAEAKKIEAEKQLLTLQAELTTRSTSWVARTQALLSRTFREETEEMKRQLPSREDTVTTHTGYVTAIQEVYQQKVAILERQFEELASWHKTLPSGDKKALSSFYSEQGKALKDHQGNIELQRQQAELEQYRQEHGTIAEITKKYPGYIVHGINLLFGGRNNPMLENAASWQDKLMVVMTERPPLSASFVKEGNGPQQLWSPLGIVFKDGIVAEGRGGDALSEVVDTKTKTTTMSPKNIESYKEGLDRAINRDNSNGAYNEVITEFGATPGAIYLNLDQHGNTVFDEQGMAQKTPILYRDRGGNTQKRLDRIDYQDVFETAQFVGLPVVVMRNGILYESLYNPTEGLTIGKKLTPEDITSSKIEIPIENRQEIQRRASAVLKTEVVGETIMGLKAA